MKIRGKNEITKEMIADIRRKGFDNRSKFWISVAESLNRPRRRRYEVNLNRLEKHGKANEKIVVAALRFSGKAKERVEKAGGECLTIEEMIGKNPKGKGIRIMG
jgi:large subunit ribosomal protein L18e